MIREKIAQTVSILNETGIDLWLIFGRESHTSHEPCAELVVGASYTWSSAFLIARDGRTVAIIGNLDAAEFEKQGNYQRIVPYVGGIRESLRSVLQEFDPMTIAVNYSVDDVMSDGLTHGMWLQLRGHLEGTPYADRLVSSERIVSALRGRKSPEEVRRIHHAIAETEKLFQEVTGYIRPGRTEKQIHDWLLKRVKKLGYEPAWNPHQCPSVFTGVPEAGEAHTGPTDKKVARGHVINMDFGLMIDGYCSDLQRTWYCLRPGETEPPEPVQRGFAAIRDAIQAAARFLRPGVKGHEVDAVARGHIVAQGFAEYPHALGHQIGREAHDGAGLLCPIWERYGEKPFSVVEEGQCYTLEPRATVPGFGVATMEEIVVVTSDGCRYLSEPQTEIMLVGP